MMMWLKVVRRADNLRPEGDFQRREEGRLVVFLIIMVCQARIILVNKNNGEGDLASCPSAHNQGVGGWGEGGELQEKRQLES